MATDEFIVLTDETFACLLQKFVEEISDLESAAASEEVGSELYVQLQEAVVQSKILHDELTQVHAMYCEAQSNNRRRFSTEESDALKYFGFAIPSDGRPPMPSRPLNAPASSNGGHFINLPSKRTLSAEREGSAENETETDVTDVMMDMRATQRESTPDAGSTPGGDGAMRHRSTSRGYSTTPLQYPTLPRGSPSPTVSKTARASQLETFTITEHGRLEDELMRRLRESLERDWEQDKRSMQLSYEEKMVDLQKKLVEARSAMVESKERAAEAVAMVEERYATKLQHAEDALARQRHDSSAEVDRLQQTIAELRRSNEVQLAQVSALEADLKDTTEELNHAAKTQERLWKEIEENKQRGLDTALKELRELMGEALTEERIALLRERNNLAGTLRSVSEASARRSQEQRHQRATAPFPGDAQRASLLQDALERYEAVRNEATAGCTFNLDSCSDGDVIDDIVLQTLNHLALPFPIAIRRLDSGGDYFIDRRVQIRVVNGQAMVRPRQPSTHAATPNPYEHLAQYILHLYAPLLDLDDDATSREHAVSNTVVADDDVLGDTPRRIAALQQQHDWLLQSLHEKQQVIQQYNRRVTEQMSPSPESHRWDTSHSSSVATPGWRRPPSPSPMPIEASGRIAPASSETINDRLKRGQQALLKKSLDAKHSDRSNTPATTSRSSSAADGAGNTHAAKRRQPDLSLLSSQELEQLKRAALAQQLREVKKLNVGRSNYRQ